MSNYKVVFRADRTDSAKKVLWEPGCPIAIDAVQISRNTDTGEAFLQLKVENVTDHTIGGVSARAVVTYSSGATQQVDMRELDADISCGATHTFKPVRLENGDAQDATVTITGAASGGSRWESAREPEAIPKAMPLKLSETALGERKALLGSIGDNPNVLSSSPARGEGWWVCGCGSINVGTERCRRCGAELQTLVSLEDERQLEQWADERESARVLKVYEDATALQGKGDIASLEKAVSLFDSIAGYEDSSERAAECKDTLSKAKKAKEGKTKRLAITVAAITAAIVAAFFIATKLIIPSSEYNAALEMVEQGRYDEAIEAFEQLGDFKDSSEQILNTKTAKAIALIEDGSYKEAFDILKELDLIGATTEPIIGAFLDSAERHAGDADYETAYNLAQSLSPYVDTDELARSYAISAGDADMAAGYYSAAVSWYGKAGDDELVLDAEYHYVKAHFDNEDLTTFEYMKKLRDADYLDSAALYEELYAWHVDLNGLFFEGSGGRYNSGHVYLRYRMSGGEPGTELTFHVEFSYSGNFSSDGRSNHFNHSYDFTLSMEDFQNQLAKENDGGYTTKMISSQSQSSFYRLTPGLYSNLTVTVTVTAGGETLSETMNLV